MRPTSILLALAAAAFLSSGHALSMTAGFKETKISKVESLPQADYVDAVQTTVTDRKRLLRSEGDNKETGEERAINLSKLKKLNEKDAAKIVAAAADEQSILKNAALFARWNRKDKAIVTVFNSWISHGHSFNSAMLMALRYENYLKNPSLFH